MRALLLLISLLMATPTFAKTPEAVERITTSKTIQCGYVPFEPYISKNLNTGALSGLTHDYITTIATGLGLKVEWHDTNIDQLVPALETGRIDAVCLPLTPDVNYMKVLEFVASVGALSYYTYVPEGSTFTEAQLPNARFVVVDGYAAGKYTKLLYPKGQFVELAQTTSVAEQYDQLRYGKADAIVNDGISAANYMANNSGIIKRFSDKPVWAAPFFLGSKKGDAEMRQWLETHFDSNIPANLALMKSLVEKYPVPKGALLMSDECQQKLNVVGEPYCANIAPLP